MINPIIKNLDGIENNPYAFLFKSNTETKPVLQLYWLSIA